MKVYIVTADLWSVGDLVTKDDSLAILCQYNAVENRKVFSTLEKAEEFKKHLEEIVAAAADEDDPIMEYSIEEYEVN